MNKKVIAVTLAAASILQFSACGKKEDNTASFLPDPAETSSATSSTDSTKEISSSADSDKTESKAAESIDTESKKEKAASDTSSKSVSSVNVSSKTSSVNSTASKGSNTTNVNSRGVSSKNNTNNVNSKNTNSSNTSTRVEGNGTSSSNTTHGTVTSERPSNTSSAVVNSTVSSSVASSEVVSSEVNSGYSVGDAIPYSEWLNLDTTGRRKYLIDKSSMPEDLRAYAYPFDVDRILQDIRTEAENRGMLFDSGLVCIDRHFDASGNDLGNAGWTFPVSIVNTDVYPERLNGDGFHRSNYPEDIKYNVVDVYLDYIYYACEQQWTGSDGYKAYESLGLTPVIFFNFECEESSPGVFDIYIPYGPGAPTNMSQYFNDNNHMYYQFGRDSSGRLVTFYAEEDASGNITISDVVYW